MGALQRGEFVTLTYLGQTRPGFVALASLNGWSVIVMFDGMLGGYAGTMPLAWAVEGGEYHDLICGHPVGVVRRPRDPEV